MSRVEEEYMDVLQNIEFAIVQTYREHPGLSDSDVKRVLEALIDIYTAEKLHRPPRYVITSELGRALDAHVRPMCEWRLGRAAPVSNLPADRTITIDELVLCFKRLIKSINLWTREGGPQGYLHYIVRFVR
jgi:hypothetical protein